MKQKRSRTERRAQKRKIEKARKKEKKRSSSEGFGEVVFEEQNGQWWWFFSPGQETANIRVSARLPFGPFLTRRDAEDHHMAQIRSMLESDDYSEYDRKFFAAHPEAHQIIRPPFPNEQVNLTTGPVFVLYTLVVVVVQLMPGERVRTLRDVPVLDLDDLQYQNKPLVITDVSFRADNIAKLTRCLPNATPRILLTFGGKEEPSDRDVWDVFDRNGLLDCTEIMFVVGEEEDA